MENNSVHLVLTNPDLVKLIFVDFVVSNQQLTLILAGSVCRLWARLAKDYLMRILDPMPSPTREEDLVFRAIDEENFSLLKRFVDRDFAAPLRLDFHIYIPAAKKGDLATLQWAQEEFRTWDKEICTTAAEHGHFKILRWAHGNGYSWDKNAVGRAVVKRGRLDILQWMRSLEWPYLWDESIYVLAEQNGHFELLRWMRTQDLGAEIRDSLRAIGVRKQAHNRT